MLPERKQYQRIYTTDYGSLFLTYQQATIQEQDNADESTILSLFDTARYIPANRVQKVLPFYFSARCKAVLLSQLETVSLEIMSDMFIQHQSIYEDVDTEYEKENEREGIPGGMIASLIVSNNIQGHNDLKQNYTYEQYGWMLDIELFNFYESDEKSQIVNDRMFRNLNKEENDALKQHILQTRAEGGFDNRQDSTFTIEFHQPGK